MYNILAKIEIQLKSLPNKRIPLKLLDKTFSKENAIKKLRDKQEQIWTLNHTDFIRYTSNEIICYIKNGCIYKFLYSGAIKSDGIEQIKTLFSIINDLGFKYEGKQYEKIGLILPLQNTTYEYTFTTEEITNLRRDHNISISSFKKLDKLYEYIGTTNEADCLLNNRLLSFNDNILKIPQQIFFDINNVKKTVYKEGCCTNGNFFVHGPYEINLADPNTNLYYTNKQLKIAVNIGAKGFVLHVGKNTGSVPESVSLKRMENNLRIFMKDATDGCPILLETPAGQGSELLVKYEEMLNFYKRFEGYPKLKICIDTCHVFAAGHDPLKYITDWYKVYPESIKLIHYNDSKDTQGSNVDRHFPAGGGREYIKQICNICDTEENTKCKNIMLGSLGYIGILEMINIAEWCIEHNLNMVSE